VLEMNVVSAGFCNENSKKEEREEHSTASLESILTYQYE
jgi:hypothetical protein